MRVWNHKEEIEKNPEGNLFKKNKRIRTGRREKTMEGARTRSTPMEEATPLPPLKRRKKEKSCPRTAPIPEAT